MYSAGRSRAIRAPAARGARSWYALGRMVLDHLIGNARAVERLKEMLAEASVPQAILFTGPEHVGKAFLARSFAQALQCGSGGCGGCPVCRMVASGSHLDTTIIDDDGETISIERVRALRERLALTSQGAAKIAILENVGRMSLGAEGALLKVLEEPTARTHFFLTAASVDDVLPTIRSRVTVLPMTLVPRETLAGVLERAGRSADATELLDLADGRPGTLLRYLADDAEREADVDRLRDAEALCLTPGLAERIRMVQDHGEDSETASAFLRILLLVLREELRAGGASSQKAQPAIRLVLEALADLRTNARPRLILEDVVVHFPAWDRIALRSPSA